MSRIKAIQVDNKTWEQFKDLAAKEGRILGKMLEVLLKNYKEVSNGK